MAPSVSKAAVLLAGVSVALADSRAVLEPSGDSITSTIYLKAQKIAPLPEASSDAESGWLVKAAEVLAGGALVDLLVGAKLLGRVIPAPAAASIANLLAPRAAVKATPAAKASAAVAKPKAKAAPAPAPPSPKYPSPLSAVGATAVLLVGAAVVGKRRQAQPKIPMMRRVSVSSTSPDVVQVTPRGSMKPISSLRTFGRALQSQGTEFCRMATDQAENSEAETDGGAGSGVSDTEMSYAFAEKKVDLFHIGTDTWKTQGAGGDGMVRVSTETVSVGEDAMISPGKASTAYASELDEEEGDDEMDSDTELRGPWEALEKDGLHRSRRRSVRRITPNAPTDYLKDLKDRTPGIRTPSWDVRYQLGHMPKPSQDDVAKLQGKLQRKVAPMTHAPGAPAMNMGHNGSGTQAPRAGAAWEPLPKGWA